MVVVAATTRQKTPAGVDRQQSDCDDDNDSKNPIYDDKESPKKSQKQ